MTSLPLAAVGVDSRTICLDTVMGPDFQKNLRKNTTFSVKFCPKFMLSLSKFIKLKIVTAENANKCHRHGRPIHTILIMYS